MRCTINNSFGFTNHLREREREGWVGEEYIHHYLCPVPGIELHFLDDDLFSARLLHYLDISVADPVQHFHEKPMMLGKNICRLGGKRHDGSPVWFWIWVNVCKYQLDMLLI